MGTGGSALLVAPGQALQVGGNSNRSAHIDLNQPLPVVTESGALSSARFWHSSTMLPDGQVLVTGGSAVDNTLDGVNNAAELWHPKTRTWRTGASGALARLYHSVALLLPDATVLVAGGGAPGPLRNTNAEIYVPPYLFTAGGQLAARPTIETAPAFARPGDALTIGLADTTPIQQAVLVRAGSITHTFNVDQRRVVLHHRQAGRVLSVKLPAAATTLPPGFYLLFVLDPAGVPSIARTVQIGEGDASRVGRDWVGAIGGNGGTNFKLACDDEEALVGIHGKVDTALTQIGPRCVRVSPTGQWLGTPRNAGVAGPASAAPTELRTCASGQAMTGFGGSAGSVVQQLQIACAPLAGWQASRGGDQWLAPLGAVGSQAVQGRVCGAAGVGRGLFGRASTAIDSVGMLCRSATGDNDTPWFVTAMAEPAGGLGSGTGTAAQSACQNDEVMVGLAGRAATAIDALRPLCVRVDEHGRWASDVLARFTFGGAGGNEFRRQCPIHQAISAIGGRGSSRVDQIQAFCRPLASPGQFADGPPVALTTVGGAGGQPGPTATCGADRPAHALVARVGQGVDFLSLRCRGR